MKETNFDFRMFASDQARNNSHHEQIRFYILEQLSLSLILGFPWLRHHNPHIDWEMGVIWERGASCYSSCIKQATPPQPAPVANIVPPDLMGVPHVYPPELGFSLWKRKASPCGPA